MFEIWCGQKKKSAKRFCFSACCTPAIFFLSLHCLISFFYWTGVRRETKKKLPCVGGQQPVSFTWQKHWKLGEMASTALTSGHLPAPLKLTLDSEHLVVCMHNPQLKKRLKFLHGFNKQDIRCLSLNLKDTIFFRVLVKKKKNVFTEIIHRVWRNVSFDIMLVLQRYTAVRMLTSWPRPGPKLLWKPSKHHHFPSAFNSQSQQ